MKEDNGIIKIGRKGLRKFAFGEEGAPFEVDVIVAFQEWIMIDDGFRPAEVDDEGNRKIPIEVMRDFHAAAVAFVEGLRSSPLKDGSKYKTPVTTAEALDFVARLREQYDELVVFFQPRSRAERASPDTSEVHLRFSEEEQAPS